MDYARESHEAAFTWVLCAKRLGVHRDVIRLIGEMVLDSWNVIEDWTGFLVKLK